MIKKIKKYKITVILILITIIISMFDFNLGKKIVISSSDSFLEMAQVLPPIFILIGLFDVWVPREVLIKHMGEDSGIKGILLAFFLGSFTAGPLYAAFPVALLLMKKGSKFSNVLIFIGAWSTTKLPLILFEVSALGFKFTITRLIINIFGILTISYFIEKLLTKDEMKKIYTDTEVVLEQ